MTWVGREFGWEESKAPGVMHHSGTKTIVERFEKAADW